MSATTCLRFVDGHGAHDRHRCYRCAGTREAHEERTPPTPSASTTSTLPDLCRKAARLCADHCAARETILRLVKGGVSAPEARRECRDLAPQISDVLGLVSDHEATPDKDALVWHAASWAASAGQVGEGWELELLTLAGTAADGARDTEPGEPAEVSGDG